MKLSDRLKKWDVLYFFLTNNKFKIGIGILLFFILLSIVGPFFVHYTPYEYAGSQASPPSLQNPLGTNPFGYDLYSQLIVALDGTWLVGLIGGGVATIIGLLIGFFAGYEGGFWDELLMMLTNILLVIPTIALLIIIASFLSSRSITLESVIIGLTGWPWVARAVRAQTLSLKSREFVSLSKISGAGTLKIITQDIAPNMLSYVFMVFILQFGGSILTIVGLSFIGLGPTNSVSLGGILQDSVLWNALILGYWWWMIPPGIVITFMVASLYFINMAMDEAFNPRLRST
jgi:peptide/nickel transport system permease protein